MDRSHEIAAQVRYLTASINSQVDQINKLMNELLSFEISENQRIQLFTQFQQTPRIPIRKIKP